jgi:hypothetical protein
MGLARPHYGIMEKPSSGIWGSPRGFPGLNNVIVSYVGFLTHVIQFFVLEPYFHARVGVCINALLLQSIRVDTDPSSLAIDRWLSAKNEYANRRET